MRTEADKNAGPMPSTSLDRGTGRVYGYETPALAPGAYNIDREATDPYVLLPELIHSFFPSRTRTISATTLPHITLVGAVPWDRPLGDVKRDEGTAPYPWLALLVFIPDELVVPLSMTGEPSATKALSLSLEAVNSKTTEFCLKEKFPEEQVLMETPNFIFVKGKTFRAYFGIQQQQASVSQLAPDLDRYRYLTYMTDIGRVSAGDGAVETPVTPGQPTTKYSTIMGHRTRPFTGDTSGPQPVLAHLVSLEGLTTRVNWPATGEQDAVVALPSLYSWTYTWEPHSANPSHQLFESLKNRVNPLSIPLPNPNPEENPGGAPACIHGRLQEGYTIVRHRDVAGERTTALFRGPLCPPQAPRVRIRPSMCGTDLQTTDMSSKMFDVSYSVAWDLGRSLAGMDAKFSTALAGLRRQLVTRAMAGTRASGRGATAGGGDLVGKALGSLGELFTGSLDETLKGLPVDGNRRWQRSSGPEETPSMAVGSGAMAQANLRRNLVSCTRPWVLNAVEQLCAAPEKVVARPKGSGPPLKPAPVSCDIPLLPEVITWTLSNLLSLRLVPAQYLFPDLTVFGNEMIQTFLTDDTWVDAMVDGALSVGNTVGGIDDPVREEIRGAINAYILKNPGGKVQIPSAGIIIRSALVESFPDIDITAARENDSSCISGEDLPVVYRRRHDDAIVCMFARGQSQTLSDFSVSLRLPAHQRYFVLGQPTTAEDLTFGVRLESLVDPAAQSPPEIKSDVQQVKWCRTGIPNVTPDDMDLAKEAWNWETGIMVPAAIVDTIIKVAERRLGTAFKRLGSDSGSVYLATQLADCQESLVVPFKVNATANLRARQLFPFLEEVTESASPPQPAGSYEPTP